VATKQIFVNLPVKNLKKSMEFFSKLGFSFNAQFTDDTAACMIVSDDIYVMLLTHPKFKAFTPLEICDTAKNTEVLVCLSSPAGVKSMKWFARRVRLEAQPSTSRRTTVLCMVTDFKTSTDIFGNSPSWSRAR
jgi:predicted lactoylglutathione lyase